MLNSMPETLNADLNQFTGTDHYYPHFIINPATGKRFVFTDGVAHLAETYGAHWLLDVVFSHAMMIMKNTAIDAEDKEFLVGKLTVDAEHKTALFTLEDGNDKQLAFQKIEYTDFPAKSQIIWVQNGVAMLPSEY